MILVLPPPRIFLLAPQASLSRVARDDVDEFPSLPLLPRFVEIGLLVLLNETPEKHRERLPSQRLRQHPADPVGRHVFRYRLTPARLPLSQVGRQRVDLVEPPRRDPDEVSRSLIKDDLAAVLLPSSAVAGGAARGIAVQLLRVSTPPLVGWQEGGKLGGYGLVV